MNPEYGISPGQAWPGEIPYSGFNKSTFAEFSFWICIFASKSFPVDLTFTKIFLLSSSLSTNKFKSLKLILVFDNSSFGTINISFLLASIFIK